MAAEGAAEAAASAVTPAAAVVTEVAEAVTEVAEVVTEVLIAVVATAGVVTLPSAEDVLIKLFLHDESTTKLLQKYFRCYSASLLVSTIPLPSLRPQHVAPKAAPVWGLLGLS